MSESDRSRDRQTSIEWDDWPIERTERQDVTREGGTGAATADDYVADDRGYEWVGLSAQTGDPWIIEPRERTLYQGRIDEENERVVVREDSREEYEDEESLGERLEEIGDEHDWEWLSSFARDHLEDDDERTPEDAGELSVRETEFQERNVAESADHDIAYTGTHTLEDRDGRVHVLERRFNVDDDGDRADVYLREDFLVAEEPREEDRAGDADLVAQRENEFEVDVDRSREDWEVVLREDLEEWHESHVEWPDAHA